MPDESRSLAVAPPRLEYPQDAAKFGYDQETWRVLVEAIFPGARSPSSVILALAYCKARKLDPLKRVVHIVPIWDSKRKCEVETIWPGIAELRTTASRTGEYAGKDETVFGPAVEESWKDEDRAVTVKFPAFAQVTVYRIVKGVRSPFVGPKVFWRETYATKGRTEVPNSMWADRPSGMIEKCAEAAALRLAFPEELGGEVAAEEVGRHGYDLVTTTREGVEIMQPKAKKESSAAREGASQAPEANRAEAKAPETPLQRVRIVSGQKVQKEGKKPYYSIVVETLDGEHIQTSTFSETAAETARGLKDKVALIRTKENVSGGVTYINLTHIEPAPDEPEELGGREAGEEG